MNSKRFFLALCLLTTFSLASGPLNASTIYDDGEEKRSKARASGSAEKKEEDPFQSYSVTLSQFSSRKTPFALSVEDLTGLLGARKGESSDVLAQDKRNLHRIQLISAKEISVKDLKEGDQITPLNDSQSMSSFETIDLPYAVIRDGRIVLNFRLMISTQSKKEFLSDIQFQKKANAHITISVKDKAKMLELQAEHYAELLPAHFRRLLRNGEGMIQDFDPKSVSRVPMKILQAFLSDGIGMSDSLYSKVLLLSGGYMLTFSSKTLNKFEMIEQTDLLSYLGYSLTKKKRRNGENANTAMTFHYEIAKPSYVNANKKVKSDALPTPPKPHFFDLAIKRLEETPDIPKDETSLIPTFPLVLPVRESYARFKADSVKRLEEQSTKQRPRSRSFSAEDFDSMIMEEEEKTSHVKTAPIPIKKKAETEEHSGESSNSVDDHVWNAHDSLMSSLQQHLDHAGRAVEPFKPRFTYKRANSVQNFGAKLGSPKSPPKANHNGVTSPRHSPKLVTPLEEMDGVVEGLSDLTLSAQPSSSDSSGSSSPRKRSRKQSATKKVTISGNSAESKSEKPKAPESSE